MGNFKNVINSDINKNKFTTIFLYLIPSLPIHKEEILGSYTSKEEV